MRKNKFRYLYFPRNRSALKIGGSAEENTAAILKAISHDTKLDESLSRTRRIVRDLLFSNYFDLFCTFTFNQEKVDRFNYKECQQKITKFFDNYKQRYSPNFKYVLVPEFHKNGAIHFHGMVRGIRKEDLDVPEYIFKRNRLTGELFLGLNIRKYVHWKSYKLGFFSCSRIKNHTACALYVSKYITKDLMQLPKGVRAVMASKGLLRPDLAFDEDDIPCLLDDMDFKNEFVWVSDLNDDLGLLPSWYGEQAADLRDPIDEDLEGESVVRSAALFSRMTGSQLSLYDASL